MIRTLSAVGQDFLDQLLRMISNRLMDHKWMILSGNSTVGHNGVSFDKKGGEGVVTFYARFAKLCIFLIFALSLVGLFCFVLFEAPDERRFGAITFFIFGIPAWFVHTYLKKDPISQELKVLQFRASSDLHQKIVQLLKGLDSNVVVGVYPSADLNAFAISSLWGERNVIGFSEALLLKASPEELQAIAAHEVSHVKNGDSQSKLWILAFHVALQTYPYIFSLFAKSFLKALFWSLVAFGSLVALLAFGLGMDLGGGWTSMLWQFCKIFWPAPVAIGAALALRYLLNYVFMAYSRQREYVADADAARMTSAQSMIQALRLFPNETEASGLFDSHPPLRQRRKRLEQRRFNS